jgi:hypothetical protein
VAGATASRLGAPTSLAIGGGVTLLAAASTTLGARVTSAARRGLVRVSRQAKV